MAVSSSKRPPTPHARLLYLLGSRRGTTYDMKSERLYLAFNPPKNDGKATPPGDDVIISDRAVETDRIAELVREGPDRYELHPLRPWDEIVLNGTNRVPFQARPQRHGRRGVPNECDFKTRFPTGTGSDSVVAHALP